MHREKESGGKERVDQLLVLELVVRNYILKKRWLCSEDMGI